MPAHPILMVLYTNDAVEVRYTDGPRLHVLPCGTSFSYHVPQDAHPIHCMKTVSQRCRFVTSSYRDMLLAAVDFRNRFAERPYLCEELLEPDQVVSLYAKIKEVAWPKTASRRNCEVLEDGSIRITSEDEFGSLILSSHHRDFTLCYLSLLSQEKLKERNRVKKKAPVKTGAEQFENQADTNNQSNHSVHSGQSHDSPRSNENKDDLNISPITQASCADSPQAMSNASGSPITPLDTVKDNQAKFRPFSTPTQELDQQEPVCTPYGHTAVFRDYGNNTKVEKVRFQNDSVKHSKGTRSVESDTFETKTKFDNGTISACLHTGSQTEQMVDTRRNTYGRALHDNSTRSEPRTHDSQNNARLRVDPSDRKHGNISTESRNSEQNVTNSSTESYSTEDSQSSPRCNYCWVTRHMSCDECPVMWNHVVKIAKSVAENGIPVDKNDNDEQTCSKSKPGDKGYLRRIKKGQCVYSGVPLPLPLTCIGQHLHKAQMRQAYDDGKNPVEDLSTFHYGRLKILLVDGVIYRIVRLASMKVVEVYPGDGSVLVSQGPSAHFFQHIIPHDGKVEERTYSVKSAPPTPPTANYSIKSLLKRACRFLGHAQQEDKTMPASVGICCWKYEEVTLAEPMQSTLLEKCVIPGYGKFTALSNGQVRIVFEDRTSLDMTCDFSKRINSCLEHSGEHVSQQHQTIKVVCFVVSCDALEASLTKFADPDWTVGAVCTCVMFPASKTSGMCRLLLTNGQYQMIDVKQPGIYKRYIDMAKEWADWVNSSPAQRGLFYKNREPVNTQMSVDRELQKINCFNYIIDNTVLKKDTDGCEKFDSSGGGAFKPYNSNECVPGPSILRKTDHNSNYCSEPVKNSQLKSKTHFQPVKAEETAPLNRENQSARQNPIGQNVSSENALNLRHNPIGQILTGSEKGVNHRYNPIGQNSDVLTRFPPTSRPQLSSVGVGVNSLEGFNAVREALLRTSSVIKDIDHMLEKKT